ncbi:unnamed protein product [Diatraea saccharalis]|uniref:small monomeric GTPase n=1 Tax=Diatraea saccharalis TaxID=40085 RepID=A0A9N9REW8_9NEOP|nr:unnamed protein product [Diatraea saccharalis]
MKMTVNRIRVVVLGSPRSGKSAVVVRYLTKRYIGEYSSTGDFLYQHRVAFDGAVSEVEILDTSNCAVSSSRLLMSLIPLKITRLFSSAYLVCLWYNNYVEIYF